MLKCSKKNCKICLSPMSMCEYARVFFSSFLFAVSLSPPLQRFPPDKSNYAICRSRKGKREGGWKKNTFLPLGVGGCLVGRKKDSFVLVTGMTIKINYTGYDTRIKLKYSRKYTKIVLVVTPLYYHCSFFPLSICCHYYGFSNDNGKQTIFDG